VVTSASATGCNVPKLALGHKFGHNMFAHIAPLSEIDTLVTDAEPDPALASALRKAQVELLIAR
jgi:DeoR/GlpR family transcriptional regulator of sugar metabolism